MFWNLFQRIINAVKPSEESEQPSAPSQSWPEGGTDQPEEQPEGSQEPSPTFQETADATQQDEWND